MEYYNTLLKETVDSFNSKSTNEEANIMKQWLSFWLRQLGTKNEESKNNAIVFQQELFKRLTNEDNVIDDENVKKGVSKKLQKMSNNNEDLQRFIVYWLKCVKSKPGQNLRGKKMNLQQFMLNKLYANSAAWSEYYSFLLEKVKNSETISSVNFYLNEIEALGQSGIFENNQKKKKSNNNLMTSDLKKAQGKLRIKIVKYFIDLYGDCVSWKA